MKALVGAFSVIVNTNCETDGALHSSSRNTTPLQALVYAKQPVSQTQCLQRNYCNAMMYIQEVCAGVPGSNNWRILCMVTGGAWAVFSSVVSHSHIIYRWNYLDRCILETPESGYGVDFCR